MKTATLLSAGLFAFSALANEPLTADKVEADIKTGELQNNLWHFNKIARENGGNRAFGLPGYKASSDYIVERLNRFKSKIDHKLQYFNHLFIQTLDIQLIGPDGESPYVLSMMYNNPTPDGQPVTGELIAVPVDDERGSACFEDQWEGIDATGKIAFFKRGSCAIADKLKLAKAHGAIAAVMWNNVPGTPIVMATLAAENLGLLAPLAATSAEVGEAWLARLEAGETLTVTVLVDVLIDTRETWNIIAETKEGDPNNVVVLGAHLDSVQEGPGVNDDGSGSTALLEMVGSFKKYSGFPNKVRFIWWGAEESGLVGSHFYTNPAQLSEEEADKIRFYFNYDMIGSPFPEYVVYQDSNPGGAAGSKLLFDYVSAAGKPAEYGEFGTSSDYVGFLERGIPSSGLFTGAGAPTDPCYHLACDGIDNIAWDALTINAKAAARAAATFALSLDGVPPRVKSTPAKRSRDAIRKEFRRWADLAEQSANAKSCSHSKTDNVY